MPCGELEKWNSLEMEDDDADDLDKSESPPRKRKDAAESPPRKRKDAAEWDGEFLAELKDPPAIAKAG